MISAKWTGLESVAKSFAELEKKIARKALKETVAAGVAVLLPGLKEAAAGNKDTGALDKALGQKTKAYKAGRVQLGLVGARQGFAKQIMRTFTKTGRARKVKLKKTTAKNQPGVMEVRDPFYYGGLPATGRKAVSSRKPMPVRLKNGKTVFARRVQAVQGTDFFRKAMSANRSAVQAAMLSVLQTETESAIREAAQ